MMATPSNQGHQRPRQIMLGRKFQELEQKARNLIFASDAERVHAWGELAEYLVQLAREEERA